MNFIECFLADNHKYNRVSNNFIKNIYKLLMTQRYSMPVYLRLTEYFYNKYKKNKNRIYLVIATFFKRKNEVKNQFEHHYEHDIANGVLFHHTGITIALKTKIEKEVQIFKNVTLALVDGKSCQIGEKTIIFSHVIILGKKIGKNCVIGAGSVVTNDIPDNSIVRGCPARVVGICKNSFSYLEYK